MVEFESPAKRADSEGVWKDNGIIEASEGDDSKK